MKKRIWLAAVALIVAACGGGENSAKKQTNTEQSPAEGDQAAEQSGAKARLIKLWETDPVLTTSESIIYDPNADLLYVSCINGKPTDQDENGFIAQVNLAGEVVNPQWITGLDAPKGMGILDRTLYVTNIDELVAIDLAEGSIKQRYPVADAAFLNDVTIGEDGKVWFSDSNTDKIHVLENGEIKTWTAGIKGPNGLMLQDGKLFVTTMGSGELLAFDLKTQKPQAITSGLGGGDGLMSDQQGGYIASDWNGRVFHIAANGQTTELLNTKGDEIQSADIWYIADQQTVLVPTFFTNTIAAYQLEQ